MPEKQYRTAVIGTYRGLDLAREAQASGRLPIVAVCDPNPQGRQNFKKELGQDIREFDDYRSLLDWNDFEVLIIASPDYVHEEHALAALKAGKHLLLEKPISITYEGGRRIVEAVNRSGCIVIVGFVLRYAPIFVRARQLVQEGKIGKLTCIWEQHSVFYGSDWYFHDWHATFKNTGGLLLQKGSHDFDLINWFADSRAEKVMAIGSRDFFGGDKPDDLTCPACPDREKCLDRQPDGHPRVRCAFRREVDCLDNHLVLIEYANGVKANYNECHYTPDANRFFSFIGTKGKLIVSEMDRTLSLQLRASKDKVDYAVDQNHEGHGGGDRGIIRGLLDSLDSRTKPLAGVEEGLEAVRIGLLAHESIRQGGKPLSSLG
jgi:predicted dehydrogenase